MEAEVKYLEHLISQNEEEDRIVDGQAKQMQDECEREEADIKNLTNSMTTPSA